MSPIGTENFWVTLPSFSRVVLCVAKVQKFVPLEYFVPELELKNRRYVVNGTSQFMGLWIIGASLSEPHIEGTSGRFHICITVDFSSLWTLKLYTVSISLTSINGWDRFVADNYVLRLISLVVDSIITSYLCRIELWTANFTDVQRDRTAVTRAPRLLARSTRWLTWPQENHPHAALGCTKYVNI